MDKMTVSITGPQGCGKTTLAEFLREAFLQGGGSQEANAAMKRLKDLGVRFEYSTHIEGKSDNVIFAIEPPEPPEPREIWMDENGGYSATERPGCKKFREVLD